MAFYMLDVKIFSRGKGGCVTRAAAYRAGAAVSVRIGLGSEPVHHGQQDA
jgi:hypothetical protein